MRPRIAVTAWRRALPTFVGPRTLLYTLADEYVRRLVAAEATPLLVAHPSPDEVDGILDAVDGVMLTGGGDVHPASYGQPDTASSGTDPGADLSEIALVRRARERRVPVLAICRGMQVTNVAFGGSLHQDIGQPGTAHEPISDDPAAVLAAMHPVDIRPGTRLADVLGAGERTVNTIHHQAIDRLADGFEVTALARDGIVEAIEAIDAWPLLAVQWHPEKLADGADQPLFAWLRDAAVGNRDARVG